VTSPQQFEVYPPAAEAGLPETPASEPGTQTWEQPGTEPARSYPVTAYRAPDVMPPPPSGGGSSRRGVLGLLIALPVGAVVLSAMNARSDASPEGWATTSVDTGEDPDFIGDTIEVGGHSADLPDGWSVDSDHADHVVVTNGANRLLAYSFTADPSDQATDLVSALVKRRQAGFTGKLGDPEDSSDDVQRATVKASGTFSKKPAKLTGRLWIDAEGAALLVVRILTAKSGSDIAQEAGDMTDALSSDFG
jgi:hypothetical protein